MALGATAGAAGFPSGVTLERAPGQQGASLVQARPPEQAKENKKVGFLSKCLQKLPISAEAQESLKGHCKNIKDCSKKVFDVAMRVAPLFSAVGAIACILAAPATFGASLIGVPIFLGVGVAAAMYTNSKDNKSEAERTVELKDFAYDTAYRAAVENKINPLNAQKAVLNSELDGLDKGEDELTDSIDKAKKDLTPLKADLKLEQAQLELYKKLEGNPDKDKLLECLGADKKNLSAKLQMLIEQSNREGAVNKERLQADMDKTKELLNEIKGFIENANDPNFPLDQIAPQLIAVKGESIQGLSAEISTHENTLKDLEAKHTAMSAKKDELKAGIADLDKKIEKEEEVLSETGGGILKAIEKEEAKGPDKDEKRIRELKNKKYELMKLEIRDQLGGLDITTSGGKDRDKQLSAQLKVIEKQQNKLNGGVEKFNKKLNEQYESELEKLNSERGKLNMNDLDYNERLKDIMDREQEIKNKQKDLNE